MWTTTNPTRTRPVTAITAFLPIEVDQSAGTALALTGSGSPGGRAGQGRA
jgi:hypothetical protein